MRIPISFNCCPRCGFPTINVHCSRCQPIRAHRHNSYCAPQLNWRVMDFYPDRVQVQPDGCWLWTGAKTGNGYGMVRSSRSKTTPLSRVFLTHRLSYEHYIGPIPEGTEIDHLCCVKACVNPDHLDAVPHQVNMQRQHGDFSEPSVRFNFGQTNEAFKGIAGRLLDRVLPA